MGRVIIEVLRFCTDWFGRGKRIESILKDTRTRVLRLEILDAMKRKDTRLVCALFDDYKQMGGNHYLDALYTEYMKKRNKK